MAVAEIVVTPGTKSTNVEMWHLGLNGGHTACGLPHPGSDVYGVTWNEAAVTCPGCNSGWMQLTPEHPWTPHSVADASRVSMQELAAGRALAARKILAQRQDVALAQMEEREQLSIQDAQALMLIMDEPIQYTPAATDRKAIQQSMDRAVEALEIGRESGHELTVGFATNMLKQMSDPAGTRYTLGADPWYQPEGAPEPVNQGFTYHQGDPSGEVTGMHPGALYARRLRRAVTRVFGKTED